MRGTFSFPLPVVKTLKPKVGDTRTITWFAFALVKIGREWRWLETVTVEQEYSSWPGAKWVIRPDMRYDYHEKVPWTYFGWVNKKFVNL